MSLPIIDPAMYGVSFSAKQCRNFQLDSTETLEWLLDNAGFRRFRLMSYWNDIEKVQGTYDFTELDVQIALVAARQGVVTLCLGVKQPRWPEYHWPTWALELSPHERGVALIRFVETVVRRYRSNLTIVSWQLENEALLNGFGDHIEIDRHRLRAEYQRVKELDPMRPIIMSTSNGWGIPIRRPWPDVVGFSYYGVMYQRGKYRPTIHKPWLYKLRRALIFQPVFLHELQLEPWGPTAIWKMSTKEQAVSMNPTRIREHLAAARSIGAIPIDMWGAEWWYWRLKHGDASIWHAVRKALTQH